MATRTQRFFRLVWRFNAVAIAAAAMVVIGGGLLVAASLAWQVFGSLKTSQVAVATAPKTETETGAPKSAPVERPAGFSTLGRTGLLYSEIFNVEAVPQSGIARRYRKASRNALDWLIYDPATGGSRMLIGARPNLLIEARLLSWRASADAPLEDRALFLRYVQTDSSGDGFLSASDQAVFALARPDGRDLTPLAITGELVSLTLIGRTEAVLLTRTDDGAVATHLDLVAKRVTRSARLPLAPEG